MEDRFCNLIKFPKEPVAKWLASANARLKTRLVAPASALPEVVLAELDDKGATVDLLWTLAVLLPARERVWWACLAARDMVGPRGEPTPCMSAAEAWVFRPAPERCEAARAAMDVAYIDDDTTHLATAVIFADGTLGPGDLSKHPAPAGAAEAAAFAMNVVALGAHPDRFAEYKEVLVDRALDIARGGNGRVSLPEAAEA